MSHRLTEVLVRGGVWVRYEPTPPPTDGIGTGSWSAFLCIVRGSLSCWNHVLDSGCKNVNNECIICAMHE